MTELERLRFAGALQNAICIKEKLELPYAAILAHHVLTTFDERILKGVELWMDDRLTPEFEVEGVSIADVQDTYGDCSMFVALNVMNLNLKDPDSLTDYTWFEGVDTIL